MRHGETEWSKSGQYTGLTDLPLTVEGEQQAVEARKVLEGIDFDLVLTSPLRRARRTAELAGFPDAVHEPLAVEWDYGDYEGISSDLIRKDNPNYRIWTDGVPNGETLESVAARADKIIARVRESEMDNVLIVAHGHFSRVLTARWLELDAIEGQHFLLGTAKVCTLGWDKRTPVVLRWGL
ncbi:MULTISPECIES: histidine phosphatase family protein [Arthrobacter]|uniref:Histidine phosphatase family protein n=1 Tax=Arthrobacter terricola TaxID=2547396 RepID=A0A4R5KR38_9MICC|nr:histidine phosphatase family protein [Arthrobacter sp. GN70]TDF97455.1 histidine phosphatase family protein [Arthrobacter terricola]